MEDRIFSGCKVKEVKGCNMDLYESLLKENGLILMMLTTTQFLTPGLKLVVVNTVIDPKVKFHRPKQEMDPAKVVRYRARTTVERSNSELKSCFLPQTLYSRGCCAVFDLNLSVLLLTLKRMAMVLEKRACTA